MSDFEIPNEEENEEEIEYNGDKEVESDKESEAENNLYSFKPIWSRNLEGIFKGPVWKNPIEGIFKGITPAHKFAESIVQRYPLKLNSEVLPKIRWPRSEGPSIPWISPRVMEEFNRSHRKLMESFLPSNLKGLGHPLDIDGIKAVMSDGIPLHEIPRRETAERLIAASNTTERLEIIAAERASILDDCFILLDRSNPSLYPNEHASLLDAIDVAGAGHYRSAHAMGTIVLDAFTWTWQREDGITKQERYQIGRSNRQAAIEPDEFMRHWQVGMYLAWFPVNSAYMTHNAHDPGSIVPTQLNRHASLHRVSELQQTPTNAVIAIAVATGVYAALTRWPPPGAQERIESEKGNPLD